MMSIDKLDLVFPFVVFAYGVVMTVVLHAPIFAVLAEQRLSPQMREQLEKHRGFSVISLILGGFWTLQNLWFP